MYIHSAYISWIVGTPYQLQQVLSAVHFVRVQHKKLQYFELFGCQTDLFSLNICPSAITIQLQISALQNTAVV